MINKYWPSSNIVFSCSYRKAKNNKMKIQNSKFNWEIKKDYLTCRNDVGQIKLNHTASGNNISGSTTSWLSKIHQFYNCCVIHHVIAAPQPAFFFFLLFAFKLFFSFLQLYVLAANVNIVFCSIHFKLTNRNVKMCVR